MKKKKKFNPLIKSPYYQTVLANVLDFEPDPNSKIHYVKLPDNDVLALEISTPKGWKQKDGTVALIHGLCGSSKSSYIKRMAKRSYDNGKQAIRINMRGCGIGRGLAKNIYHSGCSPDIEYALLDIKKHFPDTNIILVGYSLGANVSIKLAGELGKKKSNLLNAVFAVSPPVNLFTTAHKLSLQKNEKYAKYFAKQLYSYINDLHSLFPDLAPHKITANTSLNDIDELYIAKRAKFSNAIDYYRQSSSKRLINDINIPTKILFARDDPIIYSDELDGITLPKNIEIIKTDHGGHIGFIGMNILREFRWMDNLIEEWIERILSKI